MTNKEMAEFIVYRVTQAPNGLITGVFDDDLRAKVSEAREAGYIEGVPNIAIGRYTSGFRASEAGRQFAVKNI